MERTNCTPISIKSKTPTGRVQTFFTRGTIMPSEEDKFMICLEASKRDIQIGKRNIVVGCIVNTLDRTYEVSEVYSLKRIVLLAKETPANALYCSELKAHLVTGL